MEVKATMGKLVTLQVANQMLVKTISLTHIVQPLNVNL